MVISAWQNAFQTTDTDDVVKGDAAATCEQYAVHSFATAATIRALSPSDLELFRLGRLLYEYDSADTTTADSTGTVPAVLVTANGRRYKRRGFAAMAQFTMSGTTKTDRVAENCTIARNSVGDFTITLTTGLMATAYYIVSGDAETCAIYPKASRSTTSYSFETRNSAATLTDPPNVSLMFVGGEG